MLTFRVLGTQYRLIFLCLLAAAGLLSASLAGAVEDASWGKIKKQMEEGDTMDPAPQELEPAAKHSSTYPYTMIDLPVAYDVTVTKAEKEFFGGFVKIPYLKIRWQLGEGGIDPTYFWIILTKKSNTYPYDKEYIFVRSTFFGNLTGNYYKEVYPPDFELNTEYRLEVQVCGPGLCAPEDGGPSFKTDW